MALHDAPVQPAPATALRGRFWLVSRALDVQRRDGVLGMLWATYPVLKAKWKLRRVRVLGHARVWGDVHIRNEGAVTLGDGVRLEGTAVRIDIACGPGAEVVIGDGTYLNYGTNIGATRSVRIGRDCAIGQYSMIMDNDFHTAQDIWQMGEPEPVVIEDGVWLGARVIVLRGSHIGVGAVIGANSVVKGTIPPRVLAAGSPARVIRRLDG
jgi:maltose O-acetyltransferase